MHGEIYGNLQRTVAAVIDVITAPEKINSPSEWRIFRAQKIAFSPSWSLNYGGTLWEVITAKISSKKMMLFFLQVCFKKLCCFFYRGF